MADRTESSIVVDAAPDRVLDVIADFDAYPEWTGAVREAQVLRRTRTAGRAPSGSSWTRAPCVTPTPSPTGGTSPETAPVPSPGPSSRRASSRRWTALTGSPPAAPARLSPTS